MAAAVAAGSGQIDLPVFGNAILATEENIRSKIRVVAVVGTCKEQVIKTVTIQIHNTAALGTLGQHLLQLCLAGGVLDDVNIGMLIVAMGVGNGQIRPTVTVDIKLPNALQNALFRYVQVLSGIAKGTLRQSFKAA